MRWVVGKGKDIIAIVSMFSVFFFFKRNRSLPKKNHMFHYVSVCLIHFYSLLGSLFSNRQSQFVFCRKNEKLAWKIVTKGQSVVSLVEVYTIPHLKELIQIATSKPLQASKNYQVLRKTEVVEVLEMKVIVIVSHQSMEVFETFSSLKKRWKQLTSN